MHTAVGRFFDTRRDVRRRLDGAPIAVSPDGALVAVTVHGPHESGVLHDDRGHFDDDEMFGSRLLVVDAASGAVREPFNDCNMAAWSGQWSSDGRWLLAHVRKGRGEPHLAVWDRQADTVRCYGEAVTRAVPTFARARWSRDERSVIFGHDVATPANDRPAVHVRRHEPQPQATATTNDRVVSWTPARQRVIARLDLDDGHVTPLTDRLGVRQWRSSPDGIHAACMAALGTTIDTWDLVYALIVAAADGSGQHVVAEPIVEGWGMMFSWSPDGSHLAWFNTPENGPASVWCAPVDGSTPPRQLCGRLTLAEPSDDQYQPPMWSRDRQMLWVLTPNELIGCAVQGDKVCHVPLELRGDARPFWLGSPFVEEHALLTDDVWLWHDHDIWRIELTTGAHHHVLDRANWPDDLRIRGRPYDRAMDLPNRSAWFVSESGDRSLSLVRADLASGQVHRVVELGPRQPESLQPGELRHLSWQFDGDERKGLLLLPCGWQPGRRVPVVMEIYPGERWAGNIKHANLDRATSMFDPRFWPALGYAFFKPDLPCAGGEPLDQIVRGVDAALDALLEAGVADPQRIMLIGQSFGGYAVLSAVTRCHRFAAAVASAGFADLVAKAVREDFGYVEHGQPGLGTTFWQDAERYRRNSPLHHFHRVRTPVLLVAGDQSGRTTGAVLDANCAYERDAARDAFIALRRADKPAELRVYEDQSHSPLGWAESCQRDLAEAMVAWFERWAPVGR